MYYIITMLSAGTGSHGRFDKFYNFEPVLLGKDLVIGGATEESLRKKLTSGTWACALSSVQFGFISLTP